MTIETNGSGAGMPTGMPHSEPEEDLIASANADSGLEQAYARLVAAINAQPAGGEARYLARFALLLLERLQFSDSALQLIEVAHEKPESEPVGSRP
jgi:hypothetical protein